MAFVSIRKFSVRDLFDMNHVGINPESGNPLHFDFSLDQMTDSPDLCYIAKGANEETMGYVFGKMDGCGVSYHAHVNLLTVYDEYRRKRVATKLMKHFEQGARANGAKYIDLIVRHNNVPAVNLYHKIGYIVFQKLSQHFQGNPPQDGLDMRKLMSGEETDDSDSSTDSPTHTEGNKDELVKKDKEGMKDAALVEKDKEGMKDAALVEKDKEGMMGAALIEKDKGMKGSIV